MRTTISLTTEIHHQLASIARDRRQTLSATVEALLRQVLEQGSATGSIVRSDRTGLPVVTLGRPITVDDVRALDDA